jgi:hypothetical protein
MERKVGKFHGRKGKKGRKERKERLEILAGFIPCHNVA